jgi:hypothetical protein
MRQKPILKYCGLTIILSQPSRFDLTSRKLLSGISGQWFCQDVLRDGGGIQVATCDVRTSDLKEPFLEVTRSVLLLGERALHDWVPEAADQDLLKVRGYVFGDKIKMLASFTPVDAFDMKDYEGSLNPGVAQLVISDTEDSEFDQKKRGRTARSNFRFWLQEDAKKLCRIHKVGMQPIPDFHYNIRPSLTECCQVLRETKGQHLYIDVETDSEYNINTFGFSFGSTVYVVPILRYNYQPAYDNLPEFFRSLAVAFRDNIVVAHNGKSFDFFLLAWRYGIMIGREVYDTMLAQQRCFPEAEKSLSHCISLWIDNWTYHKEDGVFMPINPQQEQALWKYNGLDISSMILVHQAQQRYAETIPGLGASIKQVNRAIRPYLIMEMTGIAYDQVELEKLLRHNDRMMMQLLRCMQIMHGSEVSPLISNQKCCRYFHDLLGYPAVKRTKTGNPSFDENALLALQLKHPDNPIIAYVIAFRALKKESGTLKFFPMWKQRGILPTINELKEHKEKYANTTS